MALQITGTSTPITPGAPKATTATPAAPTGSGSHLDEAGNLVDNVTGAIIVTAARLADPNVSHDTGGGNDSQNQDTGVYHDITHAIETGGDAIGGATNTAGNAVVNAAGDVVNGVGDVVSGIGNGIGDLINGIGSIGGNSDSGAAPDVTPQMTRINNLSDTLEGDRQKAGIQADVDRGLGMQTRDQQQQSIAGLQAAANGTVPSAAELAATRQSGIDAARQYGLAAALQGNNPSAALRQASMGAAKVAGDNAANAGILRAKEQADARNALATTLAGVRQGDQGATATDVTQQGTAQTGETTSQGQGVNLTSAQLDAKAKADAAKAQLEGAKYGALATGAAALIPKISDKRAKKDIAKASLADALGKKELGVVYSYRPETGEEEGPHFGLLAQDLERVIPGIVEKGDDGMRRVDTGHLSLANTAIMSELAARLMKLEKGGRR